MDKNASGAKRLRLFDKYKPLMIAALLLISFAASAQVRIGVRQKNLAKGYDYKELAADSLLRLPKDTLPLLARDSGSLAYKNNIVWVWNGLVWDTASGSGSGGGPSYVQGPGINITGNVIRTVPDSLKLSRSLTTRVQGLDTLVELVGDISTLSTFQYYGSGATSVKTFNPLPVANLSVIPNADSVYIYNTWGAGVKLPFADNTHSGVLRPIDYFNLINKVGRTELQDSAAALRAAITSGGGSGGGAETDPLYVSEKPTLVKTSDAFVNPGFITSLPWTKVTGTSTVIVSTNTYTDPSWLLAVDNAKILGLSTLLAAKSDVTHNHSLDALVNLNTTGKASGDLLSWNGTNWVKVTPFWLTTGAGDIRYAPLSHNTDAATLTTGLIPAARFGNATVPVSSINATGGATGKVLSYDGTWITPTGGSGATDLSTSTSSTQVTVNSNTGIDAVIPAATSTNAGVMSSTDKVRLDATPKVFNIVSYGAIPNDGISDQTAINAAIAAMNAAGGGTLYIPEGRFHTDGAFTTITTQSTIQGMRGHFTYNYVATAYDSSGSVIVSRSATANLFTSSSVGTSFEKVSLICIATTPTAGIAINLTNAGFFRIVDCTVWGFWDCIRVISGAIWEIRGTLVAHQKNYGLYIDSPVSPDAGDASITGSWFIGSQANSTMILYKSSGGLKITNTKFNSGNGGGGPNPAYMIDCPTSGGTSDFHIANCSFENWTATAIRINATAVFSNLVIDGNQFSPYATLTGNAISITGNFKTAIISDNIFHDVSANTNPAVLITSVSHIRISDNEFVDWLPKVEINSSTDVTVSRDKKLQTITDGATVIFNVDKSEMGAVTLAGDRALQIDNAIEGEHVRLYVQQDATGGRTLVAPANGYSSTGSFTLDPTPNSVTQLEGVYDGSRWFWDIKNMTALPPKAVTAADFIFAVEAGGDALSPTEESAITQLLADLNTAGLLPKMVAIYPMIGSTAGSHKWNLMNPTNSNAGFRLTFPNGATHDGTGVSWNGTSQYANTNLTPSSSLTLNDLHVSYWSGTNASSNIDALIGAFTSGVPTPMIAINLNTGTGSSGYTAGADATAISVTNPAFDGLHLVTRINATTHQAYRNTTLLGSNSTSQAGTVLPNVPIYIAARDAGGTAADFATQKCKFVTIGKGLTGTEVTALYNAINTYNTTLGR